VVDIIAPFRPMKNVASKLQLMYLVAWLYLDSSKELTARIE